MSKKAIVPEGADDIGFIDPVEQLPSIHTKSGRVRKEAYEAEMERLLDLGVALSGREPESARTLHAGTPSFIRNGVSSQPPMPHAMPKFRWNSVGLRSRPP